jgi:hypothetical protein
VVDGGGGGFLDKRILAWIRKWMDKWSEFNCCSIFV